ncbi:MAG: lipase family protein, partial [Planctomycetaceae bacterium]
MSYALNEDSPGDLGNARFLAVAADLAYLPAAEGPGRFQQELGLTAQLVSHGNTQAYVAGNEDHLVLAFRGTESP